MYTSLIRPKAEHNLQLDSLFFVPFTCAYADLRKHINPHTHNHTAFVLIIGNLYTACIEIVNRFDVVEIRNTHSVNNIKYWKWMSVLCFDYCIHPIWWLMGDTHDVKTMIKFINRSQSKKHTHIVCSEMFECIENDKYANINIDRKSFIW